MNHQRQIISFFSSLGVVVGSIFFMNFFVDVAGNRTMSQVFKLSEKQKAGEIIIAEKAFDQRMWIKGMLQQKENCPEVLIMGSSTIGGISQEMMHEKTLNAWLTGPTIEDYEAIYAILQNISCRPANIVIGIDPWFLNKNMVSERWKTLTDEYLQYRHQKSIITRKSIAWERIWEKFKDQLSFLTTKETFASLIRSKSVHADRIEIFEGTTQELCKSDYLAQYPDKGENVYFRAGDGHSEVCPQFSHSEEEVKRISETYLSRNMHNVADWREVNTDAMTRFETLVGKFAAEKINVLIVVPPYHPITYQILQKERTINVNLKKMENDLKNISSRHNVSLMNLQDAKKADCTVHDFEDSHHGNETCIRRVGSLIYERIHAQ